jgi:hypothetical protein
MLPIFEKLSRQRPANSARFASSHLENPFNPTRKRTEGEPVPLPTLDVARGPSRPGWKTVPTIPGFTEVGVGCVLRLRKSKTFIGRQPPEDCVAETPISGHPSAGESAHLIETYPDGTH